ncbi:restriction endonuclease subunit S [Phocaeicola plebeius]|uniref:restriction endonuclease subunit S n=1 Tax=Phocaeicola plebeius TaxID=310297 RepID=UPI0022E634FE|nr:restriction endonuclease subunit S [Phocaeicola plebeius]
MDTKKLRQKILDLAIRGKLVPQDPNDEPASVLLERIKAEKERLIKEGKIKRSKKTAKTSDTPHYENVPFEIPGNWVWTTLGNIGIWQSGGTPSRSNKSYYGGNIPWLKTGDLNDGLIINIPESITEEAVANSSAKINPTGSVLMAMYGATIGKLGILTFPATTNQACCACIEYYAITQYYLFYFLLSHRDIFIAKGGGGAQPNISKEIIVNTAIPLPPLPEQERIIIEIERWFAFIDEIEQSKTDLQFIVKKAKSKILDLAIHGKLVPQDPNDEPASELLKRINPKAEITCDNAHYQNLPFNIPSKWIWTTLGQIGKWQSGSTPNRLNKDYYGGNIPWLKTGDLNDGYITHISENITEKALNETPVKLNPKGCVLIAMYGATIGKIGMLTYPATTNQACCACDVLHGIEKEYLFYFLLSYREKFIKLGSGGAQPNISKEKIINTYIPIPPHSEQKRIVATIHKIFAKLDTITESL